jgi:hypothetical protein
VRGAASTALCDSFFDALIPGDGAPLVARRTAARNLARNYKQIKLLSEPKTDRFHAFRKKAPNMKKC